MTPQITSFKLRPGAKVFRVQIQDKTWAVSRLRADFRARGLPDKKFDVSHELMMQGYDAV